ncbi:LLM class flavin-dependent oxidoreductase [Pedococcus sp. NPDC057267]|uniref:LLM class flavin-dependent oxidoreductase n=1 Tax=Pedococcus sp. NPDC057267 TaxID=3346077 RepID=UPI0036402770
MVVLVGPTGSGKSTWAARHYRRTEVVSSDALRAVVGSGEYDLEASADAFAVLHQVVAARSRRGLTVVVDTLGLDPDTRYRYREMGRAAGLPCVAVVLDTPASVCRERNARRDRPVPAKVLAQQLARMPRVVEDVSGEGWDAVLHVDGSAAGTGPAAPGGDTHGGGSGAGARGAVAQPPGTSGRGAQGRQPVVPSTVTAVASQWHRGSRTDRQGLRAGLPELVLQVSRFPWGQDPVGWLRAVALAADEVGFSGLALMDHLLQIPQVDRAWEPIPEPWVTLGLLAGLGTSLRLGTLVSPLTFRPAGVLAKAAATLDVLSGGRAFVGVGAGWWEREHLGSGVPFPRTSARLDLLEDGIETMRALWASGTRAYAGQRVSLPETTAYPRPVGPLPVVVGGGGERRTLRVAARLGDACNVSSDPSTVRRKVEVLHRHCAQVGRDPAEVAVTVLDVPVVGRDREDTWRRVERLRGRTAAAAYARSHHAGEPGSHVERYRQLAREGVDTVFVALPDLASPDDLERLAPVLRDG